MVPLLLLGLLLNTILGPNAMSVQGLGELFDTSPTARLGMLALWTLAVSPAARAALLGPGLSYLRWLPMPAGFGQGFLLAILLVLQAPLALLMMASGRPLLALSMWLAGVASTALLFGRPFAMLRFAGELLVFVAMAAALAIGQCWLSVALSIVLTAGLLPRAWREAPARSQIRRRPKVVGGPTLSLACVLWLHSWRREAPTLLRAAIVLSLGLLAIRSLSDANSDMDLELPVLVASTPFVAALALLAALAMRRARAALRWMSLSMGGAQARESLVSTLLVILLSVLASLVLGAPVMRIDMRVDLLALVLLHACFLASFAVALTATAPLALPNQAVEGGRAIMAMILVALVDMLALGVLGTQALIFEVALVLPCLARALGAHHGEPSHA